MPSSASPSTITTDAEPTPSVAASLNAESAPQRPHQLERFDETDFSIV